MTSDQDIVPRELSDEMSRNLADVVNGVQEAKEVRTAAFEKAMTCAKEITKLLRGHEALPRRILLTLDTAAGTLENEAAYSKEPAQVNAMAQAIRWTLAMLLRGESHDDRKPGVPRIV